MKYGEGTGGSTRVCRRAYGCGLWRSISEGWENFSKYLSYVEGMVLVFFFGMICGLETILLKLFIHNYLCVQPIRKLVFLKC